MLQGKPPQDVIDKKFPHILDADKSRVAVREGPPTPPPNSRSGWDSYRYTVCQFLGPFDGAGR